MKRLAPLMFFALYACGEPHCPSGTVAIGRRCETIVPDSAVASELDGSSSDSDDHTKTDASLIEPKLDGSTPTQLAECVAHGDCPVDRPECDAGGHCVPCTSDDSCHDRAGTPHCEIRTASEHEGQCARCTEDSHCMDSTSGALCEANACVECRAHADCTSPARPQCGDDGRCVACTSDDACSGRPGTELCALDGFNRGLCVECLADSDCPDADAPECKLTNRCGLCTSDDACADRVGLEHCHRLNGTASFAHCVQCKPETEEIDCGSKSCIPATGQCED